MCVSFQVPFIISSQISHKWTVHLELKLALFPVSTAYTWRIFSEKKKNHLFGGRSHQEMEKSDWFFFSSSWFQMLLNILDKSSGRKEGLEQWKDKCNILRQWFNMATHQIPQLFSADDQGAKTFHLCVCVRACVCLCVWDVSGLVQASRMF